MKYLSILGFFAVALPVYAFFPLVTEVERPYDVVMLSGGVGQTELILGTLDNYPVMYELSAAEEFPLRIQLRQPHTENAEPLPLGLIAVRVNDDGEGITEVERLNPAVTDWQVVSDPLLGMTFWEAPALEATVASGTYRFEVSSTDNRAQYIATVGTEAPSAGYFDKLAGVKTTYTYFEYPLILMVRSPLVFYPLGSVVILLALVLTWRYRKVIAHVS